jgi:gamma-glutamylcyclotransferase (GGCT)/AIG2-like uncharacterized protein YtfP
MSRRCPAALSLGAVVLEDYQFRFCYHADVVEAAGSRCHGVMWEITDECLASLDRFEGYPDYYDRREVEITHRGNTITAWVYVMTGRPELSPPSDDYLTTLKVGYEEHGISDLQLIEALDSSSQY